MSRKPTPLPISFVELKRRYLGGETAQELGMVCGVSHETIYRWLEGVRKRTKYHQGQCLESGCVQITKTRGYCRRHYARRRFQGEFTTKTCSVEGCERIPVTKSLCSAHYRRTQREGIFLGPIKSIGQKGLGYITSEGYRCVGGRKQHRIVMEKTLGRPLLKNEHVHHLNGDKADNQPENLELWVGRQQPRGVRVVDRIRDAVEVLRFYAPELLTG